MLAAQRAPSPEVSIANQSHRAATLPAQAPRYAGPTLLTISFATIAVTAALGPSADVAPLGVHDNLATPPWHLNANPSPWLVTALLVVGIAAGVAALALGLTRRWQPDPKRLLAGSALVVAVLAFLPPIGSADSLSYAAYGRMVSTGHNPYTTSPADLAATDPVERAVETPWQHTPSVYGPLATAEQAAASAIAGDNVAMTVLLIDLTGALVFAGAGLLLYRMATTPEGRRRATILWIANPLLWLQLVAGGHLDVLDAAAVLASLAVGARSSLGSGFLAGVAAAVKAPAGLAWIAIAWSVRHSRRALVEVTAGAALIAGVGYVVAGHGMVEQLSRASRMVSLGTPWRPVADLTDPAFGHGTSRHLIGALAFVLFVVVAFALTRVSRELRSGTAVSTTFVLAFAYVLAAPYALPWYDAIPWVVLPVLAASRVDGLLVTHTGILSLAYIPGRAAVHLHGPLHTIATTTRQLVCPIVIGLMLVALTTASTKSTNSVTRLE